MQWDIKYAVLTLALHLRITNANQHNNHCCYCVSNNAVKIIYYQWQKSTQSLDICFGC